MQSASTIGARPAPAHMRKHETAGCMATQKAPASQPPHTQLSSGRRRRQHCSRHADRLAIFSAQLDGQSDMRIESGSVVAQSEEEAAAAAIAPPPEPDRSIDPGLVLPRGSPGAWDEAALGKPVVRCFLSDEGQRWCMWHSGRGAGDANRDAISPGTGSAGLATSSDGVRWKRSAGQVPGRAGRDEVGRILSPNTEDWWTHDTAHLHVSDVQMLASSVVNTGVGVYWLYYSGGDFAATQAPPGMPGLTEGQEVEGLLMRPGLALSQDGRNWARIEGEHHSGALFDVGEPGDWDAAFVGAPQVVAATPVDLRMFYHSWDCQRRRYAVGFATSSDGVKWRKQGPVFDGGTAADDHDTLGALNVHVVKDGDLQRYLMFYEAVAADGRRSIGLAASDDGIRGWKRLERPLLEGSKEAGAWDGEVGGPSPVPMAGGRYRLYYTGRPFGGGGAEAGSSARPWEGIGLAINPKEAPEEQQQRFEGLRTDFERLTAAA